MAGPFSAFESWFSSSWKPATVSKPSVYLNLTQFGHLLHGTPASRRLGSQIERLCMAGSSIVWSKASIIYYPHASQPLIEGLHFPSKRYVSVPQPSIIQGASFDFEPPSLISLSSCDRWLFGYFPSFTSHGVGCLWQRGDEVDEWQEKYRWTFVRGAGPVAAAWIGGPREWSPDSAGNLSRLPLCGPSLPFSESALVLVTQASKVMLCFAGPIAQPVPSNNQYREEFGLKMIEASLLEPSVMQEHASPSTAGSGPLNDLYGEVGGPITTHAAITTQYGDPSILIALRNTINPTSASEPMQMSGMELEQGYKSDSSTSDENLPQDWGIWGEKDSIDLCEVRIAVTRSPMLPSRPQLSIFSRPVSSHPTLDCRVAGLQFQVSPTVTRDPSTTIVNTIRLIATSTQEGISPFRHTLTVFDLIKTTERGSPWIMQQLARREWSDQAVAFTLLPQTSLQANKGKQAESAAGIDTILVGLNRYGSPEASSDKITSRMHTEVRSLTLVTLDDNQLSPVQIRKLPVIPNANLNNASLSPNETLIGIIDDTSSHITIIPVPVPKQIDTITNNIARTFLRSIRASHSSSDIIGLLTSNLQVTDAALVDLFDIASPGPESADAEMFRNLIGTCLEVQRAKRVVKGAAAVRQVELIQDICSVSACVCLFVDHEEEDDSLDLDAVWALVDASRWFMLFLEKLARECIYLAAIPTTDYTVSNDSPIKVDAEDDLFGSAPSTPVIETPTTRIPLPQQPHEVSFDILHLLHPLLFANLNKMVANVLKLRQQLQTAPASTTNARLAQTTFTQLLDTAGVVLEHVPALMKQLEQAVDHVDNGHLRRSLVQCTVVPELHTAAANAARKFGDTDAVDRLKLFLNLSHDGPGLAGLSLGARDRDSLTKSILGVGRVSLCTRCGGRSHVSIRPLPVDRQIRATLQTWRACVCGGAWRQVHQ